MDSPKFHAMMYNFVAKRIRESPVWIIGGNNVVEVATRAAVCDIALAFARAFERDGNENFDPIRFLEACSPDNNRYPMAELWNG